MDLANWRLISAALTCLFAAACTQNAPTDTTETRVAPIVMGEEEPATRWSARW